jgi:soluble lytic murein transglycosylase-like protein
MRKRRTFIALAALGVLAMYQPCIAQNSAASSASGAEQTFLTIDHLLIQAADSALGKVGDGDSVPALAQKNPDVSPAPAMTLQNSNAKSNRLDSLRPIVQTILVREGLPEELAAVIAVESSGNPLALSPKGARGLWQLMPATAHRYGLNVDSRNDERIDIEKSTVGAARYLRDLYSQFGSWPLALAAYNTGEGNLQRAIARAGSNEFATLSFFGYLPAETRQYVPAVLSAMETPHLLTSEKASTSRQAMTVYALSTQ